MSTPEPAIVPVVMLLQHRYRFEPSPFWPRGLTVELVIGRRRRVKGLVRADPDGWIQLGFGPVRAAVKIRPGG